MKAITDYYLYGVDKDHISDVINKLKNDKFTISL